MAGFCDADAVELWRSVRADIEAAGGRTIKPLTGTAAVPHDIAHHIMLPQVWVPLNYGGYWRLARINLDGGNVVTYDPFLPEDRQDEEPPHYARLSTVLTREGTTWFHAYVTCPIPPAMSIQKSGIWLLKTLDCSLQKIDLNCDKVSTPNPI